MLVEKQKSEDEEEKPSLPTTSWYEAHFKGGMIIAFILLALFVWQRITFNVFFIGILILVLFYFLFPTALQLTKKRKKRNPTSLFILRKT